MIRSRNRSLMLLTALVAVVLLVPGCGGDDDEGSSGGSVSLTPLADAFADQLAFDAGGYWFRSLDRADTECFAVKALETVSEQRQAELRFAVANIPLLFDADWTDAEIDDLTATYEACVGDDETGAEAFVWSLMGPQASRYADCMAPEVTSELGDRYWIDQFRARFQPPRVEAEISEAAWTAELAGEEPDPPASFTDVEPIFDECIPGWGDPVDYGDDACGGDPCEDDPDPADNRRAVLDCSRDPFAPMSFYASDPEFAGMLSSMLDCEAQGLGTLIGVQLLAYPCPEGPRGLELTVDGEPITEAAIAAACAA